LYVLINKKKEFSLEKKQSKINFLKKIINFIKIIFINGIKLSPLQHPDSFFPSFKLNRFNNSIANRIWFFYRKFNLFFNFSFSGSNHRVALKK
jgi:hypothetical protein